MALPPLRNRKIEFGTANLLCILSWKQPKQLCIQDVLDNKRWKYCDVARALPVVYQDPIIRQLSVFDAEALYILAGH